MSRVLRQPSDRIIAALNRFVEATSTIDEWDRRMQSLGIPVPPEGWEADVDPDNAEDASDDAAGVSAEDDASKGTAVPADADQIDAQDAPPSEADEPEVQT